MRKKVIITGVVFLLFIIVPSFVLADKTSKVTKKDADTEVVGHIVIHDATYGDFDGDNNNDDIECYITVTFSDSITRKRFDMYVSLYLPNGDVYKYDVMVNTFRSNMTFHVVFYNHAYVAGEYTIGVDIILSQKGNCYGYDVVTFDPPREEEPDSDPLFECNMI